MLIMLSRVKIIVSAPRSVKGAIYAMTIDDVCVCDACTKTTKPINVKI